MTLRRCTATLLLLASLTFTGCQGTRVPADEVTTRMNARDEQALDDAAPRRDAGAPPRAPEASPPRR